MKRLLLIGLAVAISGCALTREEAQTMTSLELCERAFDDSPFNGGRSTKRVALGMVSERGDSCNNYANILAAEQANRIARMNASAAMMGQAGALLQQAGPRPYPGSQTFTTCQQQGVFTNCTSY